MVFGLPVLQLMPKVEGSDQVRVREEVDKTTALAGPVMAKVLSGAEGRQKELEVVPVLTLTLWVDRSGGFQAEVRRESTVKV